MAEQGEHAVADQVGGRLLAADHGHDRVGDHLVIGKSVTIDLGGPERVDQALGGLNPVSAYRLAEVGEHSVETVQHAREAIRVVLEVAEHLGEVFRPGLELVAVSWRNSEEFRRHDRREGIGQILDHVHFTPLRHGVEQAVHDVFDVGTELLYPARGKSPGRQAPDAGVCRRVHE